MKTELKAIFDSVAKRQGQISHEEIGVLAKRVGEDPEELDDQIDMLAFDEETLMLSWDAFYKWWSEEVDPRNYEKS